ncbi:MAG TPA: type II secretion system protein [Fimbriimonadaceae bacterium]|nr:type II secretion system protein [Fimbriimonadaceae bacterium]
MRRRAFTLVELMTVVAILAILYAVLMPVVMQVKAYAQQYVAGEAMQKLSQATTMYMVDNDDTYPVAYYRVDRNQRQNWFGVVDAKGEVDPATSLLAPYLKGKIQNDYALNAKPWMGDRTGYGYNWGYLGSDYYMQGSMSNTWYSQNPATNSALTDGSDTIVFGTSSFYFAPWMPKGDGATYRYSFIDPPRVWFGNPTLDFRHMGTKAFDKKKHEVTSTGLALIVFADGHLKSLRQPQIKNKMFERFPLPGEDSTQEN